MCDKERPTANEIARVAKLIREVHNFFPESPVSPMLIEYKRQYERDLVLLTNDPSSDDCAECEERDAEFVAWNLTEGLDDKRARLDELLTMPRLVEVRKIELDVLGEEVLFADQVEAMLDRRSKGLLQSKGIDGSEAANHLAPSPTEPYQNYQNMTTQQRREQWQKWANEIGNEFANEERPRTKEKVAEKMKHRHPEISQAAGTIKRDIGKQWL